MNLYWPTATEQLWRAVWLLTLVISAALQVTSDSSAEVLSAFRTWSDVIRPSGLSSVKPVEMTTSALVLAPQTRMVWSAPAVTVTGPEMTVSGSIVCCRLRRAAAAGRWAWAGGRCGLKGGQFQEW
jgi:hypothetical protein